MPRKNYYNAEENVHSDSEDSIHSIDEKVQKCSKWAKITKFIELAQKSHNIGACGRKFRSVTVFRTEIRSVPYFRSVLRRIFP